MKGFYIFDESKNFYFDHETYVHNNKAHDHMYILFEIYMEKKPYVPEVIL